VPGGHDPQAVGDADRVELALGELHPVLLFDFLDGEGRHGIEPGRGGGGGQGLGQVGVGVEEGDDAAVVPQAGRVHARLAELGFLGVGAGVGVVDADRQGAVLHQRFGEGFGARRVSLQDDGDPHQFY
jgi:hypothetical protein